MGKFVGSGFGDGQVVRAADPRHQTRRNKTKGEGKMVQKENGKIDFFKWLKRTLRGQRVGDIRFGDVPDAILLPLFYETVKQKDGSKKKRVVAWCTYFNVSMKDIELSKDTIRSIELVEEACRVEKRDMYWQRRSSLWLNYIWTVHVYKIRIKIDNPLIAQNGPAVMTATMRIVPIFGKELFSYMGIDAECPQVEGYVVNRVE